MHTITFYPKSTPSLEEVKAFVQSYPGGDWVIGAKISRGVVESDDGRIYLDYDDQYRDYFDKYLDEQERAELTARLGFSPSLALHIHPSHAYQHSGELAHALCESLARKWGGAWSE